MHPLDRPVWSTLAGAWSGIAVRHGKAVRQDRAFGPFAAMDDPSGFDDLRALAEPGESLWIVEEKTVEEGRGLRAARHAELIQMVMEDVAAAAPATPDMLALGDADADEMRALATLTRPGPFHAETHRIGGFLGLRDESGRLVAMAGERMRLPGFAEVSGVCTHPDQRGRGHAARLMTAICARILARDEIPLLHTYAANRGANALYERLGFRTRRVLILSELYRGG